MLSGLSPLGVIPAGDLRGRRVRGRGHHEPHHRRLQLSRRPRRGAVAARVSRRCERYVRSAGRRRRHDRDAGHPGQASFWAAAIRIATPLIFGVLGALLCERAGVLNLGIEGIFVAGAMSGWLAVYPARRSGRASRWPPSPARASACCTRILTVPLGLSQHVTGLGITLLATSAAYFGYRVAFPNVDDAAAHRAVRRWHPGLSRCSRARRHPRSADRPDLARLRAVPLLGLVLARRRSASPSARRATIRPRWSRRASPSRRCASAR